MSEELNPYQSPAGTEGPSHAPDRPFVAIVKRGFYVGHRVPAGMAWIAFLFGPLQIGGAAMNNVLFSGGMSEQMQSGGMTPGAMTTMMAASCGICIWLPVLFFGLAWAWGGIACQVRDQLLNIGAGAFTAYGKRHFVSMLVLLIFFVVCTIVLSMPSIAVSQFVLYSELGPGGMTNYEEISALTRHPANVVASIVTGVLMAALGTFVNVTALTIAFQRCGIIDGIKSGFVFCQRYFTSFAKLFAVTILILLPLTLSQYLIPQPLTSLAIGLAVGVFSTLYIAYFSVIGFGLAGSLYAACSSAPPAATTEPSQ